MGSISVTNEEEHLFSSDPGLYYAAWAVVLARHEGADDSCEVTFGAQDESQARSTLCLKFSAQDKIEDFLWLAQKTLSTASEAFLAVKSSKGVPEATLRTASGERTSLSATSPLRVQILLAHFDQALRQLQSLAPSARLGDIGIFSPVDRQHILRWNEEPPPRIEETLCSLFADQVRIRPSATAVTSWDGELSYAQMDELSAKLAGEIVRRHVNAQGTVALCFDKSLLAVVAMLAVLRARGAFVNLGIALPHQRQATILTASEAVLLIVDAKNQTRLDDHQTVPGLLIDIGFVTALPHPVTALPKVLPTDAAAITFTSGSTGTPKGIVVEHGSIATSCDAMASRLDLGPHSRVLQFASFTFDAAVGDIFYALSRGAAVCIPSERERVDDLAAAARRLQVNWAFLTPSVLSLLEPPDLPSLRRLLVGGEKPDPKHIALWEEHVSLHLVMGPAECAIYCAASDAIRPGQDTSTFGRAAGCRLWVVDEYDHSKLAPVGCVGELVVEGRIVARGYLNAPELSATAFLSPKDTPWLPSPNEDRLYKSGDLVRFNIDDGTFSFVARKDNQVKLHGQRVELNEIEIHLKNTVTDVESALVMLNTSIEHAGRHPLVAFLVFARESDHMNKDSNGSLSLTAQGKNRIRGAKDRLATVLPAYMIPTLFVPIPHVYFTANGKRDTAKLRSIAQGLSEEELHAFSLSPDLHATSRNLSPQEEQLRGLWAEILHEKPSNFDSNSDFLREGGDSLAAMHLVSAAGKLGLQLQVSSILMHPRLCDMAKEISVPQTSDDFTSVTTYFLLPPQVDIPQLREHCATACAIGKDQIEDLYPASPLQRALWTGSQRRPGTYILQMTFQLPASLRLETFTTAWDQVVNSAEILRTRLVFDTDLGLLQVVTKTLDWDFFDTMDEFNARDPFATMGLGDRLAHLAIVNPKDAPVFVFAAHHVLYDAFMLNMVFARVAEICKTGFTTPLAPFKNYISYIENLPSEPCMSFWRAALDSCPPPSWPPPSSPTSTTTSVIRQHVALPVRPVDYTTATYAYAAFLLTFASHTHTSDFVVSTGLSGRDAAIPSILDLAGLTLYTMPLRTKISPSTTLRTFLDGIRAYIRDSAPYAHIGLPAIAQASPSAAAVALDVRCTFSVQPSHVIVPEDVFGPRTSFRERMGRLPLIFECFVEEGGVEVVVEWNEGSLGEEEVRRFVGVFERVLKKVLGMEMEELIDGLAG